LLIKTEITLSTISAVHFKESINSSENTSAFQSVYVPFDETFSKLSSNGSVEDFWCSSGEKMVVPPALQVGNGYPLECGPTEFSLYYVLASNDYTYYPFGIGSNAVNYDASSSILKFFCDV
jgi:hypothetical protein